MKAQETIRTPEFYNLLSTQHKGILNCYVNAGKTHLNISHKNIKSLKKIVFDLALAGLNLDSMTVPDSNNPYCDGSYIARISLK